MKKAKVITKILGELLVIFTIEEHFLLLRDVRINEKNTFTTQLFVEDLKKNKRMNFYHSQIADLKGILEQFLNRQLAGISSTFFSLVPILAKNPEREDDSSVIIQEIIKMREELGKNVKEQIKGWKLKLKFNKSELVLNKLQAKILLNRINLHIYKYPILDFTIKEFYSKEVKE